MEVKNEAENLAIEVNWPMVTIDHYFKGIVNHLFCLPREIKETVLIASDVGRQFVDR